MKNTLFLGLTAAIILQFFVLSGVYIGAAIPLWTGDEIRVKTIPVDPRSMFRGNYARLRYDFSRLPASAFPTITQLRTGQIVYVSLDLGRDGLAKFKSLAFTQPVKGIFLRGRIHTRSFPNASTASIRVRYGIEAFFAPKKKALALEKELQNGGIAILSVSSSGQARLKDVIADIQF